MTNLSRSLQPTEAAAEPARAPSAIEPAEGQPPVAEQSAWSQALASTAGLAVKSMKALTALNIVTVVGDVTWKQEPGKGGELCIPDTGQNHALVTKIDLLQGDIQTFISDKLTGDEHAWLRQFHAQREQQAAEVVKSNIAALKALAGLAD